MILPLKNPTSKRLNQIQQPHLRFASPVAAPAISTESVLAAPSRSPSISSQALSLFLRLRAHLCNSQVIMKLRHRFMWARQRGSWRPRLVNNSITTTHSPRCSQRTRFFWQMIWWLNRRARRPLLEQPRIVRRSPWSWTMAIAWRTSASMNCFLRSRASRMIRARRNWMRQAVIPRTWRLWQITELKKWKKTQFCSLQHLFRVWISKTAMINL